jgi:signal transduction histidine kinase
MKESVLIIDDDEFICRSLSLLLKDGYTVKYTTTGKEGIEKFLETSPGIVFTDYELPDMKGLEVIRELKRINPEVDIIFMTAYGNMDVVIEALRTGVFDYMDKPIHSEIVMASLLRLEAYRMLKKEKAVLAFGVGHELNNLLTIVSGNIQLLEKGVFKPREEEQAFEAVKTALKDCTAIINKLRGYARLMPSTSSLKPLNVNDLIKTVISSMRWTIGKAIKITPNLKDCREIKADPTEIREVFINILNNACNALKGTGNITISTSQEGPSVVIRITDTGPGVPEEIKGKLFRPFTSTRGTGLGLFWSQFLLKQYGGTIDIESAPGEGTTVTLRLPCEKQNPN